MSYIDNIQYSKINNKFSINNIYHGGKNIDILTKYSFDRTWVINNLEIKIITNVLLPLKRRNDKVRKESSQLLVIKG